MLSINPVFLNKQSIVYLPWRWILQMINSLCYADINPSIEVSNLVIKHILLDGILFGLVFACRWQLEYVSSVCAPPWLTSHPRLCFCIRNTNKLLTAATTTSRTLFLSHSFYFLIGILTLNKERWREKVWWLCLRCMSNCYWASLSVYVFFHIGKNCFSEKKNNPFVLLVSPIWWVQSIQ